MSPSKSKKFTYRITSDRENKNLTILELIRKKSPISRTDIAKVADINIVSISNYVNNFLKKDLVIEGGLDISSGGRRPELLELNKKASFVIGIDIKENQIKGVLADLSMDVVNKKERNIETHDAKAIRDEVTGLIKAFIEESGRKDFIKAIGLGFSGVRDESRNEFYYDTEPFLGLRDTIEKEFKIKAFLGEDCVCAAFAEKNLNPQLQQDNILYIYSDLGLCVYIEKDTFHAPDEASEKETPLYYLRPWRPNLGIISRARHAVERGIGTKIVDLSKGDADKISVDTVIEAARNNDSLAGELIESAALNLGIRVAYLINLFNPDGVAVGGGIEKAGDLFLNPLKESIKRLAHKGLVEKLQVVPGVSGEDQVVLGAAGLTIRELFIGV